jgi:Leucine-rich repeat (LRR) protein
VTYCNLFLAAAISSPDHPVWPWLASRSGRIAGLSLELHLGVANDHDDEDDDDDATEHADQPPDWMQPLQTLSGIPDVQLRVKCVGRIADMDDPCIAQWVKQYGQLISHIIVEVNVSQKGLNLREFSEAISAPCRSIDLTICHSANQVVDLADLAPVAGSLQSLMCEPSADVYGPGTLIGASAFKGMSQLTALHFIFEGFENEETWGSLAKLTSLQYLGLFNHSAIGDPSPLSALTRLSYLNLQSLGWLDAGDPVTFSFSNLQPLSTLGHLEQLYMEEKACAATSLEGLAGLSNLKLLELDFASSGGRLKSLEGISPGVTELTIMNAPDLVSLAGIEVCTTMKYLNLHQCNVSSLQPLSDLRSMVWLKLLDCPLNSLESLRSMSLQSLFLKNCSSLTQVSGVEHLPALISLQVDVCGVTSLQPLSQLGKGLQKLWVRGCKGVQEEILELSNIQPTADVEVCLSNIKEVVLAGGVRRAVGAP